MTRAPRRVLPTLVALLLGPALLAGCGGSDDGDGADAGSDGPPTIARSVVEQQVRTQLGEEVGREPEEVTCPDDLLGEVDRQLRCMLADAGTELGVTVTVTSVDGDDVKFDIAVDETPQ